MRHLYSLLLFLYFPFVFARLAVRGFADRGYWARWEERMGYVSLPETGTPRIWIHAVSVGETQAAVPLVNRLVQRYPQVRVLVTTTTPTGAARVRALFGETVEHAYVPYDLPGSVRRFLDRARPVLAVFMETELWPNTFFHCARRSIPVIVANARLSERSARGYSRLGKLVRPMLAGVTRIAAQAPEDSARFVALGVDPARVNVTGSVKFDITLPASLKEQAQVLRRRWGVDRNVWIAASTHEGEDESVLDAFEQVLARLPGSLLVLVPRHPERFARAAALARRRGLRTTLRSQCAEDCKDTDIYVGDTMGELPLFYAASDVAFVGGSLVSSGGHNMLEPAALGVPVIMGPHVFNFAAISRLLLEMGAARQIHDAASLATAVIELLSDANLRHGMGENGRRMVQENRGALNRLMQVVEPYIEVVRGKA